MLFPITDATEAAKDAEEARVREAGQTLAPDVWYSKQTISNACGTVALLHAYANTPELAPKADSFLARFLKQSAALSPEERARFLEYPKAGEPDIEEAHVKAAAEGQTAPPAEDEQARALASRRRGLCPGWSAPGEHLMSPALWPVTAAMSVPTALHARDRSLAPGQCAS
jgi:Ubiquitin carboxyl-terminal hydrolase, family 1